MSASSPMRGSPLVQGLRLYLLNAPLSWQHIVLPCRDLRQTQRRHPDPRRIHDAALATKNATVYELSVYMLRMCDNDTFG